MGMLYFGFGGEPFNSYPVLGRAMFSLKLCEKAAAQPIVNQQLLHV